MKDLSNLSHPRLGIGCRVRQVENSDAILPAALGIMWLKETAAEIIRLCDGEHTSDDILRGTQAHYPSSDPEEVGQEIDSFLDRLRERQAVDLQ